MFVNLFLITIALMGAPELSGEKQAVQIAQAHFEAGQYPEAVKALTEVHSLAPQDPAIAYWLARAYYEQQDYDKAVAFAEEAVKLSSQNSEYQRWLGRAYGAKADQSHSFSLARKVKQAFEAAVNLAPRSIEARRDLMQYLVEAPWIVGGDKDKAKQEVDSISKLDPLEGRLAHAAFLSSEKKWKEAEAEYLSVIDQHPTRIGPYMEAADFFAARKDSNNLARVVDDVNRAKLQDPRLNFYQAVVLILRRTDLSNAEALLKSYIDTVPQRSDYPSHNQALVWLRTAHS